MSIPAKWFKENYGDHVNAAALEVVAERDALKAENERLRSDIGVCRVEAEHADAHLAETESATALGARVTALERELDTERKSNCADKLEAERLRHGVPIESDYVCPQATALGARVKELEKALEDAALSLETVSRWGHLGEAGGPLSELREWAGSRQQVARAALGKVGARHE